MKISFADPPDFLQILNVTRRDYGF